jgi:hypothetical protein
VLEREAEVKRDAICHTHTVFKRQGVGILVCEEEEEEGTEKEGW